MLSVIYVGCRPKFQQYAGNNFVMINADLGILNNFCQVIRLSNNF